MTQAPVVLVVLAYLHPDRIDLAAVVDEMLDRGAISPPDAARLRADRRTRVESGRTARPSEPLAPR